MLYMIEYAAYSMIMPKARENRPAPFVRHSQVVQRIRESIVRGRVPPGGRLPAQVELQREFGTTPVTIQRAFHRLSADGFIDTRAAAGTYVVDHPPHRWQYGLLFDTSPERS